MNGPLIFVVGMHRSGTSAIAGALASLTDSPVPRLAVPSNPDGQWERPELRPALELLLAVNGATWAHPPRAEQPLSAGPMARWIDGAASRHATAPGLWKDPRLCLTVDYWLERFTSLDHRIVFVHRDPGAVAASLQKRNGLEVSVGLALWERTVRNAVVRLNRREVFTVEHDQFVRNPEDSLRLLAKHLGIADVGARLQASAALVHDRGPSAEHSDASTLCPTRRTLGSLHNVVGPLPAMTAEEPIEVERLLGPASHADRIRAVVRGIRASRRQL